MKNGSSRMSAPGGWSARARRGGFAVGVAALAVVATACSSSATDTPVTITETTHVAVPTGSSGSGTASDSGTASASGTASDSGDGQTSSSTPGSTSGSTSGTSSSAGKTSSKTSSTSTGGTTTSSSSNPNAEPDGFVPTKLKPGEKPPQFIAVSFDGAGWHEKWEYYAKIAEQVPFHFTANLTGLYLVDEAHKDSYTGYGHGPGDTALGANFWYTPEEVAQEIKDLNKAYDSGDEIATHFMGHFCHSDPPGADTWSTKAWDQDLDQFFDALANYKKIDKLPNLPTLKVTADEIIGERTPCLEGSPEALFPALAKHHMVYDQSFTHRGLSWPKQSPEYKIWQMGMASFPLHGNTPGYGPGHFQITMDYNFWYSQEYNDSTGQMNDVSKAQSEADSKQVQATYQDMLDGALAGSHAPLLLGNHFNDWNNNAYTEALGNFLLANCGKSNVHCVPYRDVVDWMEMQDPKVMAQLQAEPPVLGPPSA